MKSFNRHGTLDLFVLLPEGDFSKVDFHNFTLGRKPSKQIFALGWGPGYLCHLLKKLIQAIILQDLRRRWPAFREQMKGFISG